MPVRIIEFKKRRVNRLNKSIPKKNPSSQEKRKGFLESKGKAYVFQIKQTLFILALPNLYTKFPSQLALLFLIFFFPFTGFPGERFREKEKFLFFPSARVVDLFLLPLPLPSEKFLEPDFLTPVFLLAID